MAKKQSNEPDHLLTTRAALVLGLAVAIAIGVGILTYLGKHQASEAILAGLAAMAVAIPLLLTLIGP